MLDAKLTTFLRVAELGGITRAAEALHLTQPAVTQQIHRLEEHYGCKLIVASGRRVQLTAEGVALRDYAKAQEANEQSLRRTLSGLKRPLRIGATMSIADFFLPNALATYASLHSDPFSVQVGNTRRLIDGVTRGELDCALIEGNFDKRLVSAEIFAEASFVGVVSATHPFAGKTVPLRALYSGSLILRETGSGTREILEEALRQRNDSIGDFTRIIEVNSFALIKRLLTVLPGVSFMYRQVAETEIRSGSLAVIDIEDMHLTHPLQTVTLKHSVMNPGVADFFRVVLPMLKAQH